MKNIIILIIVLFTTACAEAKDTSKSNRYEVTCWISLYGRTHIERRYSVGIRYASSTYHGTYIRFNNGDDINYSTAVPCEVIKHDN